MAQQQQRPRPRPRPQEEEPIGLEPQILSNKEQKEVLEHIRTFRCTDLRTYLYISSVNSPNKEELLIAALQRYMSGGSIPYWEAHDSRQRHRSLARLYLESRVKKLPDITRKMKAWTDNRSGQDDLYLSPADRAALNIYLEIAEIARESDIAYQQQCGARVGATAPKYGLENGGCGPGSIKLEKNGCCYTADNLLQTWNCDELGKNCEDPNAKILTQHEKQLFKKIIGNQKGVIENFRQMFGYDNLSATGQEFVKGAAQSIQLSVYNGMSRSIKATMQMIGMDSEMNCEGEDEDGRNSAAYDDTVTYIQEAMRLGLQQRDADEKAGRKGNAPSSVFQIIQNLIEVGISKGTDVIKKYVPPTIYVIRYIFKLLYKLSRFVLSIVGTVGKKLLLGPHVVYIRSAASSIAYFMVTNPLMARTLLAAASIFRDKICGFVGEKLLEMGVIDYIQQYVGKDTDINAWLIHNSDNIDKLYNSSVFPKVINTSGNAAYDMFTRTTGGFAKAILMAVTGGQTVGGIASMTQNVMKYFVLMGSTSVAGVAGTVATAIGTIASPALMTVYTHSMQFIASVMAMEMSSWLSSGLREYMQGSHLVESLKLLIDIINPKACLRHIFEGAAVRESSAIALKRAFENTTGGGLKPSNMFLEKSTFTPVPIKEEQGGGKGEKENINNNKRRREPEPSGNLAARTAFRINQNLHANRTPLPNEDFLPQQPLGGAAVGVTSEPILPFIPPSIQGVGLPSINETPLPSQPAYVQRPQALAKKTYDFNYNRNNNTNKPPPFVQSNASSIVPNNATSAQLEAKINQSLRDFTLLNLGGAGNRTKTNRSRSGAVAAADIQRTYNTRSRAKNISKARVRTLRSRINK